MLSSVVNDVYSVLYLMSSNTDELPAFICTWIVSNWRICSKLDTLTFFPLGQFFLIYSALLQQSTQCYSTQRLLNAVAQKYDFNLSGCEHKTCRELNNHNKETKDSTLLIEHWLQMYCVRLQSHLPNFLQDQQRHKAGILWD